MKTKEDCMKAEKAGLLKHTVLFGALVCSLQLVSATESQANIWVGSGATSKTGLTSGSDYDSASNPVTEDTWDRIYGGIAENVDGSESRESSRNKLTLGSGHTVNTDGEVYGGCYLNYATNAEFTLKDAVKAADNVVTIDSTKFIGGAAAIYGGNAANFAYADGNGYGNAYAIARANATDDNSTAEAAHGLTVSGNTVTISNVVKNVGSMSVYGGSAANISDADGSVDAYTCAQADAYATANGAGSEASATHSYTALKNTVTLSHVQTASNLSVYGGYAVSMADAEVEGEVEADAYAASDARANKDNSKAYATHGFTASENTVTLSDVKADSVYVNGGNASSIVYGSEGDEAKAYALSYADGANSEAHATHGFTATKNTVKLSNIQDASRVFVYGGRAANITDNDNEGAQAYAKATANEAGSKAYATHSFTASENTVTLSDVKADSVSVYGGYAENSIYAYAYAEANAFGSDSEAHATHSFTASKNTVELSNIESADKVEVYGGYAQNGTYANGYYNDAGAWASDDGSKAYSTHSFEASDNTVTLSDIKAENVEVTGGKAENGQYAYGYAFAGTYGKEGEAASKLSFKASRNKVELSNIEAASSVSAYGGHASIVSDGDSKADTGAANAKASAKVSLAASDNTVKLSNAKASSVYAWGGYAENNMDATIKAYGDGETSLADIKYNYEASRNTVELSNIEGADNVEVYGGDSEINAKIKSCTLKEGSTVNITESASSSNNTVKLTDVDASKIYGGRSSVKLENDAALSELSSGVTFSGTAEASNNRIELYGGSFTGTDLYAGYSSVVLPDTDLGSCKTDPTAKASDNTVALYAYKEASPKLDNAVLWGGYAQVNDDASQGIVSGNSLEFHQVQGMTAANIKNFDSLTYELADMKAGASVLTLTGGDAKEKTTITGATVQVTKISDLTGADGGEFQIGDKVYLLQNANGIESEKTTLTTVNVQKGATVEVPFALKKDENSIFLTRTGAGKVLPGTKAIAEGAAAGLALVNEAANACLDLARNFSPETGIISPFVHVQGSSVTHETGSNVHLNAISLAAGVGTGLETGFGKVSAGAFFEYGKGNYTTNNTFDNAADVNGDGNSWYMGAGILAKMEFLETGPGHFYVEGSAHMGQLHNEYDTSDLRSADGRAAGFDLDSPYYALHGGLGYVWNITEEHDLDVYGKYIWTRVDGTDETLTTGDKFEFDDMDSSRVRFGARYTYKGNEHFKPYAGVAYEHEFAGSCDTKTYGLGVPAPSFEGDTGIGELGVTMTPSKDLPLSINLGVQGYVGQKRGVSGNCMVKYEF